MNSELNLDSMRARKARAALHIGLAGNYWLRAGSLFLIPLGVVLLASNVSHRGGFACLALGLLGLMLLRWYARDLKNLPPQPNARSLDEKLEPGLLARFKKNTPVTPKSAWIACLEDWQGRFICSRLLLDATTITRTLSDDSDSMPAIWQDAGKLSSRDKSGELGAGALLAALLTASPPVKNYLASLNLKPEDVLETYSWLERLNRYFHQSKPYFGGIGRDWAAGFTPTLDRFGQNISRSVENGTAGHFHTLAHADILDSVIYNLSHGSGGVALVGETGTGKTALVYALGQRLLEGHDENLRYYQIVSLDASLILSSSADQLERRILTLFGEAARARNIILFLDEAQLFFSEGTGAFDLSQILMPVLQDRAVKIIVALTPNDSQRLKAKNEALASQLATVAITEPTPEVILQILEDTALSFEQRDNLLISYQAVREAYRLSGQYLQEQAFPGKAISALEQAIPYAKDKVITAESVQSAIEKTRGVRVSKAGGPETDILLHLEDHIHQRMINQERAVSVVASALRRGRAGVANPKRPIGSFLFLGPTGVGKTELARSLAATYFGNERQMIRLDMSEYQRPDDVARLLDGGTASNKSLILSIREQPFSVVLLDEAEKAHPHILNLLLQILDEGQLTDQSGKPASFRNAIIINTSNAGSTEIGERVGRGDSLENFERPLVEKLIKQGIFNPELINRFDEIVLFRPLKRAELNQVAKLMIGEVNKTLATQNVNVQLTDAALAEIVRAGYDPEFGARPMRRVIQKKVEDVVATRILSGQAQPGSTITLDVKDLGKVD